MIASRYRRNSFGEMRVNEVLDLKIEGARGYLRGLCYIKNSLKSYTKEPNFFLLSPSFH